MAINPETVATRIYQLLVSNNYSLTMYSAIGDEVQDDPVTARFFFGQPAKIMVHLVEDDEALTKINVYISTTAEDTDSSESPSLLSMLPLLNDIRQCASGFGLRYHLERFGEVIMPKNFAFLALKPTEVEGIAESLTGSTRSSYQRMGNARMIIRHDSPVNEELMGARSRHIKSIFIETAMGERLMFPHHFLTGARAMTNHIGNGGGFGDKVGQHIQSLSEEFTSLKATSSYIYRNKGQLNELAQQFREAARFRMKEVRGLLEKFHANKYGEHAQMINESPDEEPKVSEEEVMVETTRLTSFLKVPAIEESVLSGVRHLARFVAEGAKSALSEDMDEEIDLKKPIEEMEEYFENFTIENILNDDEKIEEDDDMDEEEETIDESLTEDDPEEISEIAQSLVINRDDMSFVEETLKTHSPEVIEKVLNEMRRVFRGSIADGFARIHAQIVLEYKIDATGEKVLSSSPNKEFVNSVTFNSEASKFAYQALGRARGDINKAMEYLKGTSQQWRERIESNPSGAMKDLQRIADSRNLTEDEPFEK